MNAPRQEDFATDQAWFDALRAYADPLVLAMLADGDGAILGWQVPAISEDESWEPVHAFEDALERGVIRFDAETDCYVHPKAREVATGGYEMTE